MNDNQIHPLNHKEKNFAAEHYELLFSFMDKKRLVADEFHDALVLPYLAAVQKFLMQDGTVDFSDYLEARLTLATTAYIIRRKKEKQAELEYAILLLAA